MKNILLLTDAYFPNSRATIAIVQRIAEGLAKRGNKVTVFTNKDGAENPIHHQGVDILYMENEYQKSNNILNKIVSKIYDFWYARKYKMNYEYGILYKHSLSVKRIIKERNINCLISVSLPVTYHICARMALSANDGVEWLPICFDPFAYSQEISLEEQRKRAKLEVQEFSKAQRVFILEESKNDYEKSSIKEKFVFFNLPNVRNLMVSEKKIELFNENDINCLFLGNLFFSVRNPEYLFNIFCKMKDARIKLFVIGGVYGDFPKDYFSKWETLSDGTIKCFGRVDSQTAIDLINAADILVNIGNTTTNQCPSKILDYISSGKPILNVSKGSQCAALKYLKDYPLSYTVFEDSILEEDVHQIEKFIIDAKGKKHIFSEIKERFFRCTIAFLLDQIENIK